MAKWVIGKGLDEYLSKLENLEFAADDVAGEAIYHGAAIVADEVRRRIEALPTAGDQRRVNMGIKPSEKQGLLDGLGIAAMRTEGSYINVKIGMDGYNADKTKAYPNGKPNAMIARSIESGSQFMRKQPFIAPAVRATKSAAETEMQRVIDEKITKIFS